jgi:hypothetical protein
VRLQFNVVPDEGFENGMVQFNDMPVVLEDMGLLRVE